MIQYDANTIRQYKDQYKELRCPLPECYYTQNTVQIVHYTFGQPDSVALAGSTTS